MTNAEVLNRETLMKGIVLERFKAMPSNVKISFGSNGRFLNKEEILKEISGDFT